jgi:hypothetical protein
MAAFNWLEFEATCPVCHRSGTIRAQTHVAASYDGDSTGRFHNREYRLGERMAWWAPDDRRYAAWCDDAQPAPPDGHREACYASCTNADCQLCAVVEFAALMPLRVLELCAEEDWPEGYTK